MATNKICCVPWKEVWLNPELNYGVCCKEHQTLIDYSDSQTIPLPIHWQKPRNIDVKQRLLDGQDVPECRTCWDQEASGKVSMRMRKNIRYISKTEPDEYDIKSFQQSLSSTDMIQGLLISVGNQCQLRCISCNPNYSRSIIKDYQKLGWPIHQKNRFDTGRSTNSALDITDKNIQDFKAITHQLTWISLVGGEPTLSRPIREYLRWCIDQGFNRNITIQLTTNGVNVKDDFLALLQQFQQVIMTVSADGFDQVDEYVRWPGRWNNKVAFIDKCRKIFPNVTLHSVVYSFNCLDMDRLIRWADSVELSHNLEFITWPEELAIEHMPLELKQIAREKLQQTLTLFNPATDDIYDRHSYTKNCINSIIDRLSTPGDPVMWQKSLDMMRDYNRIREHKIQDLIPELAPYING